MKRKLNRIIALLAGTLTLLLFVYLPFHSQPTTAQNSFISNLPAGYVAYPGSLAIGKYCTCSTGGISGAPPGPPPCNTSTCFGSSNTRYAWVNTNTVGIRSAVCDEQKQKIKGLPPCFQLDGDDALVISGSISPLQNLAYYSFNIYQTLAYNEASQSKYTPIQASVNLGFNNSNLQQGANGKYVLIFAANTNTINVVKQSLRATGVPDAIINTYLVPSSVANLGNSSYPEQLSLLLRLTAQSETERQQVNTFIQKTAPATAVIFIKGPGKTGDVTFNNLRKWENTIRVNSLEYRLGLDQNLAELERNVKLKYAQQGYRLKARIPEKLLHVEPNECRANFKGCVFDSPDAVYTSFPCEFSPGKVRNGNCQITLEKNSDDVVMWLGVDHTLVGQKTLAAYWSGESQGFREGNDGTFSFVGLYTQGSAKQYMRPSKAHNLYAVKISRNCGKQPFCAAVPYRTGPKDDRIGFIIVGRTYLDKLTGSGPNPANLVPSALLWFTKS